jgi:drug/metabolite transporter (DMT)-like permease
MPIDFARLPTVAILGALIYGEQLDPFIFLGAALIFGGNYLNITKGQSRRA